ncbi:MAG: hypothetical protein QOG47_1689, partial [Mycobacterium sp.]|nr:hypothetical protein [Mycobacterium sp.]
HWLLSVGRYDAFANRRVASIPSTIAFVVGS